MYKIYIKKSLLILARQSSVNKLKEKYINAKFIEHDDTQKQLLKVIESIEKKASSKTYVLTAANYKKLRKKFKKIYITVDAAGGLVINENGKGLFIFKRGKWDLPKGKLESGESLKEAAVREVEEETSVSNLKIGKRLCKTKHTYRTRSGKRAIKQSYWFLMKAPNQKVTPQTEEDIEAVEWIDPKAFAKKQDDLYTNLVKVLRKYQAI
jgi:ADP-ribose pyrophosphatase YjhB (NUDIX family)